jgi:hypothetical protein
VDEAKPFRISKREVWEAFKSVKANQGAAGVDGQSIAEFEADLEADLPAVARSRFVMFVTWNHQGGHQFVHHEQKYPHRPTSLRRSQYRTRST